MLALFAVTVPAFTLIGGHAFAPLTRALHPRMDLELTPQLIEFAKGVTAAASKPYFPDAAMPIASRPPAYRHNFDQVLRAYFR